MTRAERRRLSKILAHPDATELVKYTAQHVVSECIGVLRRDFGFGDKRIERLLDSLIAGGLISVPNQSAGLGVQPTGEPVGDQGEELS